MQIQSDAQKVLFGDWILQVQPSEARSPRLLFLLHGWTGDENSMWVFVRGFPTDYWIVAPRAPYIAEPSGYSWRPSPGRKNYPPSIENLQPSVDTFVTLVDSYSKGKKIDGSKFSVIGFSQGAAMTNTLALLHPDRIQRVGVLAGFVPSGAESLIARRPLAEKSFFVAHGTQDDKVRIDDARRSVQSLEKAGAQVTFCEAEVGHKVSADCLRALQLFFA